ncbi:Hypothetical predicted protein [Cloeon dipterum]|uniref:Condensin complex subunit 2 n=1 Tax=Cloeon dipterum TaxID=197152 RepID=A0A8S1CFZ0_9INSE|nr:Hypothetical predicted protein [Cloeon dipterum]
MIDQLGDQIRHQDSAVSKNFQLASCSLDAGTKIYAARVDCVAKSFTDFSMVMTMANKNCGSGNQDDDVEDKEDEGDTLEAKKKRIKRLKRSQVYSKNKEDLLMDQSKNRKLNSTFPVLGNLMQEAVDSFKFTERPKSGVEELQLSMLEKSEPNTPMKIAMDPISREPCLCPTLKKFSLKFELSENGNDLLNNSFGTNNPFISLKDFNESSLEDNIPEPENISFDGTIVEEAAPCHHEDISMVADRTSSTVHGLVAPLRMVNEGRMIQLQGPAFWKWKKPSLPVQLAKAAAAKKAGPKHEPINFNENIDLAAMLKKAAKVNLTRETVVKWDTSKLTLPFEVFEAESDSHDCVVDITKYSLPLAENIPSTEPLGPVEEQVVGEEPPTDEFFNDQNFPAENAWADNQGSDDENDSNPLMEDLDAETFSADLANLFNNTGMSDHVSYMTNINLDESHLISAPQVIDTVLPEWKPAKRFNMKKLEASLWERITHDEEGKEVEGEPFLHQLYDSLPKRTQESTSVTTVLYALLNVANKKGISVKIQDNLSDCKVERISRPGRKSGIAHPAVEQQDAED